MGTILLLLGTRQHISEIHMYSPVSPGLLLALSGGKRHALSLICIHSYVYKQTHKLTPLLGSCRRTDSHIHTHPHRHTRTGSYLSSSVLLLLLLVFVLQTGFHCVDQVGFELEILLPHPPEGWDHMHVTTILDSSIDCLNS